MDFTLAPELEERLAWARRFLEERVLPLEPRFLREPFTALEPDLEALRDEVRGAGLFCPEAPEELGGAGMDLLSFAHLGEVLGRSPLGHYAFHAQAPDAGNMALLHRHGSAAQRERWLAPLARGEVRSCFAMTEPETPGSNPTLLATRAERDGEGWLLTGRKWFATGADGAAFAVVMAVTDPDAPARERATLFVVPMDTPGLRQVRNVPVMGHAGEGWHSHGELELDGARVPDEARIGEVGEGFALAQSRLSHGRIHHCTRWLGVCGRAMDMLMDRALDRPRDAESTLADSDLVRAWVAELSAEVEAARWLTRRTAWGILAEGERAARVSISLLKFHVAGVLDRVLDRAVQVHGALGLTEDTVLAFLHRTERAARIYDGPDEVHKLAAGRRLLRARAEARAEDET